ncbi:Endoribonuclease YbeY [Manis javanica]|nr:Endoribonuclease YbeY [Manis javanica]
MGKLVKLLLEFPNSDLGPLFSSSTFWFDTAGVKADDELLLSIGFGKAPGGRRRNRPQPPEAARPCARRTENAAHRLPVSARRSDPARHGRARVPLSGRRRRGSGAARTSQGLSCEAPSSPRTPAPRPARPSVGAPSPHPRHFRLAGFRPPRPPLRLLLLPPSWRFLSTAVRSRPGVPEMSLVLRNLQRAVPLRRAPLRRAVELVRGVLGVQKFDLAVICVDNKNIQHINKTYREKNVPTDVLSFPYHENLKAGEMPQPHFPDDYNLGDIFLGVEYIFQQCKENEDYYDLLTVTATHGLCHLLGFTHGTEAEWQKMYQREKQPEKEHAAWVECPSPPSC